MMKMALMGVVINTWKSPPMFMLISIVTIGGLLSSMILIVTKSHWAALLLIMIYISGVMVLFMYVASISPYEKKKISQYKGVQMALLMVISMETMFPHTKEMKVTSYMNSFELNIMTIMMSTTMVIMMASILPVMAMNHNKGLKSSK